MSKTDVPAGSLQQSGRHSHFRSRRPVVVTVESDAASEGVTPRFAWVLAAFPALAVFLFAAAVVFRPAYDRMLEEDYPVEWLQFTCILFASMLAAPAAVRFARRGQWLPVALLVVFAAGAFGLAGEEISWGQRVLGIATPSELSQINDQGELGFHNITEGGLDIEAFFRQVQTLIAVAGTLLPLLTRLQRPLLTAPIWRLLSPPLFLIPLFAPMWIYRAVTMTVLTGEWRFGVIRFQEWVELCMYVGLAVMVLCIFVGVARSAGGDQDAVHLSGPMRAAELRTPEILFAALLLLTLIFAVLSLMSGIKPGNA